MCVCVFAIFVVPTKFGNPFCVSEERVTHKVRAVLRVTWLLDGLETVCFRTKEDTRRVTSCFSSASVSLESEERTKTSRNSFVCYLFILPRIKKNIPGYIRYTLGYVFRRLTTFYGILTEGKDILGIFDHQEQYEKSCTPIETYFSHISACLDSTCLDMDAYFVYK